MLDSNFKVIKTISKINDEIFTPRFITTDGRNRIFFTALKSRILKCDLDLKFIKQFGTKGSGNEQLDKPCGIKYFENFIYVCDYNNQRIQKLNEELLFKESYPLNFKPWEIEILNNIACIRSGSEASLVFYNMNPFYLKTKVNHVAGSITSFNSWFYQFDNRNTRIFCYNIHGDLVGHKLLRIDDSKNRPVCSLIINFFDEKILILKK